MVCMMQSLFVDADDAFQQAMIIWETSYGPMHEKTTLGYQNYAYFLVLRGDYPRALELAQRALHAVHQRGAIMDLTVARRLHIIGWALQRMGRHASAVRCLRLALYIRKTMLNQHHVAICLTSAVLGDTLLQMNKIDEADAIYQQAYTAHVAGYGEHASFSGELLHRVGHVLLVRGNLKGAISTLRQALRVLDLSVGQQGMDSVHCRHTLAHALVMQEKHEEAWPHYQLVHAVYRDQLIANHPDTVHVQQRIANIAAKYPLLMAHER
jgi:tetratricopeptide (TPR) repeat protein